jgi:hypothetical protein
MSLEIQTGKAILWGINGSPTVEGYAGVLLQDGKLEHKFKMTPIEDEREFDVSLIATNEHFETTLTWTPASTSRAGAAATVSTPEPFKKITLSGFEVEDMNGDWIYVGDASVNLSHTAGKMSLKVRKYVDALQNASLASTVSG